MLVLENLSPNIHSGVRILPVLQPQKPPNHLSLLRCRPEPFLHISELQVSHLQLTKDPAYSDRAYLKFGSPTRAVLAFRTRQVI